MPQWDRVKAIVNEALEHEGAARNAYVEKACADDDALHAEVESLLASYDESASLFDTWEQEKGAGSVAARIGPYRVIERLGRGGMGTVYRAERDDTPFQRQVALKVLHHGGHESDDFTRRFFSERQILASLSHPGIARLYDGGLAEDGRPYFAMELVSGQPITRYCDEEQLSVKERLQLFLRVAEAVRYAHRNLVVHRDLKPSNILITEDGTPKLLDFGIAKLLSEEAPFTRPLTRTGQLLMTPEYAAPEQVKGEAVTTATDVYQLGVLLYELLAGRRPHVFARKTPSVIEQVILEEEPEKPSTAAVTNADSEENRAQAVVNSSALEGDLDTIVLKALRKEPERRYGSVGALVEDVERHLEGRPITARPVTWRYQARKFVRRNRWSVGAVSAFVALLAAYAVTVTVQARQIATERDRAQAATVEARQSARKSQQMSQFLVGLFEEADPRQSGGELTARDLLDQASAQLDTGFTGYPIVEADLLEVIGNAYRNQGHYQETYELHRRSLELRKESGSPSRVLAMAQNNVGEALYYLGRYDEAELYYRRSLQTRRRVLDSSHVDIAQSLNNLALLDTEGAHYEQAERRYKEALAIFRAQLGKEHWRTINAMNNLAHAESNTGSLDAAERHYRNALDLRRRIRSAPDRDAAIILNNLGGVLRRKGRLKEAEKVHRQALNIFQQVTAEDAPFIGYSLLGIARVKQAQERYEEAEDFFGKALTHHRKSLPEGHERIARPLLAWGRLYLEQDRPADAEPLLREALQVREQAFPMGHWKTAEVRRELASSLIARRRYTEAEDMLLGEYEALRKRRSPSDRHVRAMKKQLVRLYEAWGKPDRAAPYRDTVRQGAPKTAAANRP